MTSSTAPDAAQPVRPDVGADVGPDVSPDVEVRRSPRRRRTVSAYRDGGRIVVMIPSRFSKAEEDRWVAEMVGRLDAGARRRRGSGDGGLSRRAAELSTTYLGGRAQPVSVRWVASMRTRWASCTPADGTIRLSERLRDMPHWVRDYVLVHELAHLLVPGHGPDFWALVQRYPRTERARGYLDGVSAAAQLDLDDDLAGDVDDAATEAS
ncbi:MAG TPA: M48 family metallopeptidase [Jatrophihabitantaceae bacterium]|nr:M48 family metallopeptidase [Jatrophihabitantaceae bacterium]